MGDERMIRLIKRVGLVELGRRELRGALRLSPVLLGTAVLVFLLWGSGMTAHAHCDLGCHFSAVRDPDGWSDQSCADRDSTRGAEPHGDERRTGNSHTYGYGRTFTHTHAGDAVCLSDCLAGEYKRSSNGDDGSVTALPRRGNGAQL
jgi:hypothetical protein